MAVDRKLTKALQGEIVFLKTSLYEAGASENGFVNSFVAHVLSDVRRQLQSIQSICVCARACVYVRACVFVRARAREGKGLCKKLFLPIYTFTDHET